jgi:hypothetical protein
MIGGVIGVQQMAEVQRPRRSCGRALEGGDLAFLAQTIHD